MRTLLAACGSLCLTALIVSAQAAAEPDWSAHPGRNAAALPGAAAVRHERSAGRREAGGRLPEAGAREGRHSGADLRARGAPAQRRRAAEGQRHASGRCCSWGTPTSSTSIRRSGRIRLSAATRDGGYVYGRGTRRRQGQRDGRADDDADAEAAERAARSRRHLPGRSRRGRHDARRHPVHGRPALRRDRRRVLPRRRRRREPGGRQVQVRVGADAREDSARDRAHGPRRRGHGSVPLKDNAIVHLSAAVAAVGRLAAADQAQRDDRRVLQAARRHLERPRTPRATAALLSLDPKVVAAADDYMFEHEPRHASMLRSSASPNIVHGRLPRQRHSRPRRRRPSTCACCRTRTRRRSSRRSATS